MVINSVDDGICERKPALSKARAPQAILAAAGKSHVLGDMGENDEDADEDDDAGEEQDDGGLSEALAKQAAIR